MKKIAVVLFNLGGPDSLEAVKPFLFNLFHDKAIIRLPQPLRWLVATLISRKRAPYTQEIYRQIGNSSPLLEWTQKQATALEEKLNQTNDGRYKVFICMRYWHPFAQETAKEVKAFGADEIILLPLYPQYSTTTTSSSFRSWQHACERFKLSVPTRRICCYPAQEEFIAAHSRLIKQALQPIEDISRCRILFSAHGLPKKIIAAGDPYQWQVEQTVQAVMEQLGVVNLDYSICYQSRVGPLEWIGPATEDEIRRAGNDGKQIILTPIAFVSEHSETLVELDREYAHLAKEAGVERYIRVPALGVEPLFIESLAFSVRYQTAKPGCLTEGIGLTSGPCSSKFPGCGMKLNH